MGVALAAEGEDAELEKARAMLKKFDVAVRSDEAGAEEIHEAFMKMSERVRRGYGRHLEREWKRLKGEVFFLKNQNRTGGSKELDSETKKEVKAKRQLLAEIRSIPNEGEMEKRLVEEGWPALEFLVGVYGWGDLGPAGEEPGESSSDRLAQTQAQAVRIGRFRYELFESFGIRKERNPAAQLGIDAGDGEDDGPDLELARREDRKVLEKNEVLAAEIEPEEAAGIRELNEWRMALGLGALQIDPKLCAAGRDHSKDMAERGFFAHESPVEGKRTFTMRAANFDTRAGGENIALNGRGAKGANRGWFHSPGHHKNMFSARWQYVGLGGHGRHWTQMFR